jgi:hypothetical protein
MPGYFLVKVATPGLASKASKWLGFPLLTELCDEDTVANHLPGQT